jgi:rhodanese-related sulfurtransferase
MKEDLDQLLKIQNHLRLDATILDVRSKWEYFLGHIPNSINIPLSKLELVLPEMEPSKKKILVVCATGKRSQTATNLLIAAGCDAVNGGSWVTIRGLLEQ